MKATLPFLPVDEELNLNVGLVLIIMMVLGQTSKGKYVLDFEKIQIFLYLVKNPSKISSILSMVSDKYIYIDPQFTHTIESMSSNVDSLFIKDKLKNIIKYLAYLGFLACHRAQGDGYFYYHLNDQGILFVQSLISEDEKQLGYFFSAYQLVGHLKLLQSQSNSKLNMFLNSIFKRNLI